jgi:hypothetical protein
MMIWEECVVSPPLMAFFNVEIGRGNPGVFFATRTLTLPIWRVGVWEGKGMASLGYEGYPINTLKGIM